MRPARTSKATWVDDSWKTSAACRDAPTDLFFVHPGKAATEALELCSYCVVRPECLAYAKHAGCRQGIFGGLTPRQRR